jgi:hypothetical protein
MKWVIIGQLEDGSSLYGRIDDDGLMRVTAVEEHPELQTWIAEGNEPEVVE